MHCKHLLHYRHGANIWSVASCSAKNNPYVPSLNELERFCRCGRHTVCPAYLFSFAAGCPAAETPQAVGLATVQRQQRKCA